MPYRPLDGDGNIDDCVENFPRELDEIATEFGLEQCRYRTMEFVNLATQTLAHNKRRYDRKVKPGSKFGFYLEHDLKIPEIQEAIFNEEIGTLAWCYGAVILMHQVVTYRRRGYGLCMFTRPASQRIEYSPINNFPGCVVAQVASGTILTELDGVEFDTEQIAEDAKISPEGYELEPF